MGIKNLNNFLRKNCTVVYEDKHISDYSYKIIAIDISLYLCKFKSVCGSRWISAFVNLVVCLRNNNIHFVFVYDTGSPVEKEAERKKRRDDRDKNRERINTIKSSLEEYRKTGAISDILRDICKKQEIMKITKEIRNKAIRGG